MNSSDHNTIVPPLPLSVASAMIRVLPSTTVLRACCSVPPPCRSPPIRIVPPPAGPLASIVAPASPMRSPVMVMEPPFADAADLRRWRLALAESRPETVTVPPAPPPSTMAPERPLTVRASTTPVRLIACRATSRAVAALISTRPPFALIRPLCWMSAFSPADPEGTSTSRKPSPEMSRVARSPAPRPTFPSGTLIVPAFSTEPPSRAAYPPGPTSMLPWLTTAAEVPVPVKLRRPAAKSSSLMPSVDATKPPPALTVPLGVIMMPLGLTR